MQEKKRIRFILGLAALLLLPILVVLLVALMGVRPVGTPLPGEFSIQHQYRSISANDGRRWRVIFQWPWDSTFAGSVRHVETWQDASMPFMSHDILVTSADFANPQIVNTSVRNHHYYYNYSGQRPSGHINLLHIFPASAEILADLQKVQHGDEVRIRGREIFLIRLYDAQGNKQGFFTDTGCNTILVTEVEISP